MSIKELWKPYCTICPFMDYYSYCIWCQWSAGHGGHPHLPSVPAGLLTWRHLQLEAHQRVEDPGAVAHAPVLARVLAREGHHGNFDHLGLDIILQQVARPLCPDAGKAGLTLPLPHFAPHLAPRMVFAVLVGALHRQSLPFEMLHFGVHTLDRVTWGNTTC